MIVQRQPDRMSKSWRIYLASGLIIIILAVLSFEGVAWGLYTYRDAIYKASAFISPTMFLKLDPYEEIAQDHPRHWRLKPGYDARGDELIKAKNDAGKWLGVEALRETQSSGSPDRLIVNSYGFKGPPIDSEHKCPRLLSIGDSVTFGIGGISYPYFLQKELHTRGHNVEVINAGVEGYSPRNLLLELPRYQALKPDFVTIYIGWNALYAFEGNRVPFKSPWLIDQLYLATERLRLLIPKTGREPLPQSINIETVISSKKTWSMEKFKAAHDVEQLIDAFQGMGAKVFVITLYGLFQSDRKPSEAALKFGHLPRWTKNPYDLARLTDQYNLFLRRIAIRKAATIIDLQDWGREHLVPSEIFLFDSVHFNTAGLNRVGTYLAETIGHDLRASNSICATKE